MSIVLHLRLADKKMPILRGNDHFWSVIMDRHRAGQTFSAKDIDDASNASDATVRDFVRRLANSGMIELVEQGENPVHDRYRPLVIQSAAPRVRRDGTVIESLPATQCMWNLMRGPMGRNGFTYKDLVHWGQTDETTIAVASAKSWIKLLNRAGFLIQLDAGNSRKPATWRLDPKMNSGPRAPMILRTKLIYDPNKLAVIGPSEAEEEQP